MNATRVSAKALVLLTFLVACLSVRAQNFAPVLSEEVVDYHINAVRADLKANKAAIINEELRLTPEQAAAFWPLYKQYDRELSKANDDLVNLMKTYATKSGSLTDGEAKDLTVKALNFQHKELELRRKYFPKFSKAMSPLTATKFYQTENSLESLCDSKLMSAVTALLTQTSQEGTDSEGK